MSTSQSAAERVIVVLHADGYVEVRGTGNVLATVINRPLASTRMAGDKVDQLLQNIVPRQFRDLLIYHGDVIGKGQVEKITPQNLLETLHVAELANAIRKEPRKFSAAESAYRRIGGMRPKFANRCACDVNAERRELEREYQQSEQERQAQAPLDALDSIRSKANHHRKSKPKDWSKIL